jgi:Rrf2 family protein
LSLVRITTWGEYGLIIALHLARRAGRGPVAARALARAEGLPHDYVEQILLRLRRAGVIASQRGARGGYALAGTPATVTVRDVLAASEGAIFEVNCDHYAVSAARCDPAMPCPIRPVWRTLATRIDGFLSGLSLEDLLRDEAQVTAVAAAVR